ncbi:MAG: hypothetical protein U0165_14295 [Polyangiaceae bacterium]
MSRLHRALLLSLALSATACTTRGSQPQVPPAAIAPYAQAFAKAAEAEQTASNSDAIDAYLKLVQSGLEAGEIGGPAVLAGLDALVWRTVVGVERIAPLHAIAYRSPGAAEQISNKLSALHATGKGAPYARAILAQALLDLAKYRGDAQAADCGVRNGLVTCAAGVGPIFDGLSLRGVENATAVEDPAAPFRESYAGIAPFSTSVKPVALEADDGVLDVVDINAQPGLYALVADVELTKPTKLTLLLQSTSAAAVVVGGKVAVTRPFSLGGGAVVRIGTADVGAGKVRIVARVGANDDGSRVTLRVLDEHGDPVATSVPAPGTTANLVAGRAGPVELAPVQREGLELFSAALACLNDTRTASRLLEDAARQSNASPLTALLYARTVYLADDVPEVKRIERMRASFERAVAGWPTSWEALIGQAVLSGARKSFVEGRAEALRDLLAATAREPSLNPLVHAFAAGTAAEANITDVARAELAETRKKLDGAYMVDALDAKVIPRIGKEAESLLCETPSRDRQSLGCLQIKAQRGDHAGFDTELARLRALRGSQRALLTTELRQRMTEGDIPRFLSVYDALAPGQRTMSFLGLVATSAPDEVRKRINRDRLSTRDTPTAIPPLRGLLGDDVIRAMEAKGAAIVAEDRKRAEEQSSAATLVLLHDEKYDIEADGMMHIITHDIRRVMGTTDVESGIGGTSAGLIGRDVRRVVRRIVHKKNGRDLEPFRPANAAQGHADLSQLEPGDTVEQIVEGWALPNRAGQIVVDTPDLLPERTGVARASLEIRYPKKIEFARHAHALLGKPQESDDGDTHIVRFELKNALPRRIEDGLARMDRDVSLSFGTYSWNQVARHIAETLRALDDKDPYVTRWAKNAAGEGAAVNKATVEKVLGEIGKTIKVANGGLLSDVGATFLAGSQAVTARHILEIGQGTRTWPLYRVLRELGIDSEIVVAEREPFSADPAYPARPGRFEHPLLVVHLPAAEGGDVWIDADVSGPPLPLGRVSPELRGRVAIRANGEIIPVQGASSGDSADEAEIKLVVDANGNAKGTLTATQRGRPAQQLAEALERVVGADRREMLRAVVLGWMPWATVDDVSLSSSEGSWQIQLRAEISVPSFAQREGKSWVLPGVEPLHAFFPRPAVSTIAARLTTQAARDSALAIDNAFQYRIRRHIELPQGATITQPPSVNVKHERLEASRKATVNGNVMDEELTLSISTGTVSVEAYRPFAAEVQKVDDAFLGTTRVKLP